MNKKAKKLKITYNAPVTLTFTIITSLLFTLDSQFNLNIITSAFCAPSSLIFNPKNFLDYIRILFHIFGHSSWEHLISNMAFILLLGPVIEERYGSFLLCIMMITTSAVTGVLNACFCNSNLIGCSDIAFMLILLTSFTSIKKSEVPLTFILILILYIGREIVNSKDGQNISVLAHIAGGLCGSLFAFLASPKTVRKKKIDADEAIDTRQKKEKKAKSIYGKTLDKDTSARLEEIDQQSPRFASSNNTSEKLDSNENDNNNAETILWRSIDL